MRPPESVYRGEIADGQYRVTVNGCPLAVRRRLPGREMIHGIAWGQSGTGPKQLAHALVFDATGDPYLAAASHVWIMWALVSQWGQRWEITAGQVARWVEQWRRESRGLRLSERYDWAAVPVGWPPPAIATGAAGASPHTLPLVVPATGTDGPVPVHRLPAGRVRLVLPPTDDGLEGGGV
jgi:hypothetical protein